MEVLWSAHPLQTYHGELAAREIEQTLIKQAIHQRLTTLVTDAARDDESTSPSSFEDLERFLLQHDFVSRPALFLLDNGNFRALWSSGGEQQVGLQFLGGGVIQYVIFVSRPPPLGTGRSAGRELIAKIRQFLQGAGADKLVFA